MAKINWYNLSAFHCVRFTFIIIYKYNYQKRVSQNVLLTRMINSTCVQTSNHLIIIRLILFHLVGAFALYSSAHSHRSLLILLNRFHQRAGNRRSRRCLYLFISTRAFHETHVKRAFGTHGNVARLLVMIRNYHPFSLKCCFYFTTQILTFTQSRCQQ